MFIGDTFVDKTIEAFLTPVIWGAILYFSVNYIARLGSPLPHQIHFRRLVLMLIGTIAWCLIYSAFGSAFIGNGSDPHNAEHYNAWTARQLGTDYGMPAMFAWLLVAIINRPKIKTGPIPEPPPSIS